MAQIVTRDDAPDEVPRRNIMTPAEQQEALTLLADCLAYDPYDGDTLAPDWEAIRTLLDCFTGKTVWERG